MRSLMLPLAIGSLMLLWTSAGYGQEPSPSPVRIGTFDSRAIATAFYNSAEFGEKVQRVERDLEAARAAGDSSWTEVITLT